MKNQLQEDLKRVNKSILYCKEALNANLEKWEAKEFRTVLNELQIESSSLESRILMFN
jgi:hypothetical protein